MQYKALVLDFETQNPLNLINESADWIYKNLDICGCAVKYPGTDQESEYFDYLPAGHSSKKYEKLKKLVESTENVIVFNASFDVGILINHVKADIKRYRVIDVFLMAKMYDSTLDKYSLNSLARRYLKDNKTDDALGTLAKELGFVTSKAQNVIKVAKKHMRSLQDHNLSLVADYAIQDVELTYRLFQFYLKKMGKEYFKFDFYSDLIKSVLVNRQRGVRIDLYRALEVENIINMRYIQAQHELNQLNDDQPLNVNSSPMLGAFLLKHGIEVGRTEAGSLCTSKDELDKHKGHVVVDKIINLRKLIKFRDDFVGKIINYQKIYLNLDKKDFLKKRNYGIIHPRLNILGAIATGRFSCEDPNIQQIPVRDKELAPLVRSLIVPFEGEELVALDYPSQESRLQVHLAHMYGCNGTDDLVEAYNQNPELDLHSKVAEIMGVERSLAKTINLGLSYGMGKKSLAKKLELTIEEAEVLIRKYHLNAPFLSELIEMTQERYKRLGYVVTLDGRYLRRDKPVIKDGQKKDFDYKAFNKLIQGSAAGQAMEALVQCYREGIPVLYSVHDELVASVADRKTGDRIAEIMSNSLNLVVPMPVKPIFGKNWSQCK